MTSKVNTKVYFSDIFGIKRDTIEKYGAIDISLLTDLPLFIDPFLLFNSKKKEYQNLHKEIINYLTFLRNKSSNGFEIKSGLVKSWYTFPEVSQIWLGYSSNGSGGNGLGNTFANSLNNNLNKIFNDFGNEKVSSSSHLEKLCLIEKGVGRDHISDFTANLIKGYLLNYTQDFATKYLKDESRKKVVVDKVKFNYTTQTWERAEFTLPYFNGDYVLLTPQDILTKDEIWINRRDLIKDFESIPHCISNEQLRDEISNYFLSFLPKKPKKSDEENAISKTILRYPELIDYYIKFKESEGDKATKVSLEKVSSVIDIFVNKTTEIIRYLENSTDFYTLGGDTYSESQKRIQYLKHFIEKQDGYRLFYEKKEPVKKESDLQLMFRLTWFGTKYDVNREINNGLGSVDYKVSLGNNDATLIEFKLARNKKLEQNLRNQLETYKKVNHTNNGITVILYFNSDELLRVNKILKLLKLENDKDIILIDARKDNKVSASNIK